MNETQAQSRAWIRPFVGSLFQFALAATLLLLGHTWPGVLLLCAGAALLITALWTRGRSSRSSTGREA